MRKHWLKIIGRRGGQWVYAEGLSPNGGLLLFSAPEATAHRLMLVIALASASLLYWIAVLCLGRTAACLAPVCWLTLPAVVNWGHVILQESLAVLFLLVALLAFLKATDAAEIQWRWAVPGGMAMALAAWSSWESVLLSPGLLAAARWCRRPSQQRLALIYAVLALVATVSLLAWYAIRYPSLMVDTLQTAKFRMGLAGTYSSDLLHRYSSEDRMSLPGMIFNLARLHWHELGLLGLGATAWVTLTGLEARASRKGSASVFAFCGLLAPWLLWSALMPNHVANHDFEMLIAAPAAALSLAWCGKEALHALTRSPPGKIGIRKPCRPRDCSRSDAGASRRGLVEQPGMAQRNGVARVIAFGEAASALNGAEFNHALCK